MTSTLRQDRSTGKVRFRGCSVDRFGPDLLLGLDRTAAETLGAQLQAQLRDAVRTGRLHAGERLPSSRQLATELGVSRGLVVECYAQLEAEGYLDSHPGSATRVAAGMVAPVAAPGPASAVAGSMSTSATGSPTSAASRCATGSGRWARRAGRRRSRPPATAIRGASSRSARSSPRMSVGSVAPSPTPSNVVVCSGFAQGLGLVLRALARAGSPASPSRNPASSTPISRGRAGQHSSPSRSTSRHRRRGARRTAARVVVVTPAHQCPTGVVMAPERRQALVAGRPSATGSSSRTTTTPSSATTVTGRLAAGTRPRTGS